MLANKTSTLNYIYACCITQFLPQQLKSLRPTALNRNESNLQDLPKCRSRAPPNLLIVAVHQSYICHLQNSVLGFGNVTCHELLGHLWTNYGKITQSELDENQE
jgi:hypothetical protein